jgi:hypothetical protein
MDRYIDRYIFQHHRHSHYAIAGFSESDENEYYYYNKATLAMFVNDLGRGECSAVVNPRKGIRGGRMGFEQRGRRRRRRGVAKPCGTLTRRREDGAVKMARFPFLMEL